MSSSYPDCVDGRAGTSIIAIVLIVAGVLAWEGTEAAQYSVQPTAEVSAESNTNVTLAPAGASQNAEGYVASLSAVIGAATPRSETTLVPRIQYQNYPDYQDANRLEGSLDLTSYYQSARSDFSVYAGYDHRDQIDAELANAQFNELDPTVPTVPGTGRIRVGDTRDLMLFIPSYDYALTQRYKLGVSGLYEGMNYTPDRLSGTDFDYYEGRVYLRRAFTPRVDVSLGSFVTRYEARDVDSNAQAVGGALDIDMRWTKTLKGHFRISAEQNETDQTFPTVIKEKVTAWGAAFDMTHKGEVSEFIFGVGRDIAPSGSGGLYYVDQIQLQYNRDLSRRMSVVTAVIYFRESALSNSAVAVADRDYVRGDLGLKWMISPTWYVRAGYEYTWQEYQPSRGSAENNKAVLAFGYTGLRPQR